MLHLSAVELEKLGEAMLELLAPDVLRPKEGTPPPDALPVAIMTHAIGLRPPRAGEAES